MTAAHNGDAMRFLATFALLLIVAPSAGAQIVFRGGSFGTSVSANTPGCSDTGPGGDVSPASASCSGGGYAAASFATAGFSMFPNGGGVIVSGEAAATAIGMPAQSQSSAFSVNNASAG
jgi:hypothetical protein